MTLGGLLSAAIGRGARNQSPFILSCAYHFPSLGFEFGGRFFSGAAPLSIVEPKAKGSEFAVFVGNSISRSILGV
jgi:hypothetical protein